MIVASRRRQRCPFKTHLSVFSQNSKLLAHRDKDNFINGDRKLARI